MKSLLYNLLLLINKKILLLLTLIIMADNHKQIINTSSDYKKEDSIIMTSRLIDNGIFNQSLSSTILTKEEYSNEEENGLDAIINKSWTQKIKIPGTQCTLSGYSRSGYKTSFYIKEMGIMLDAGNKFNSNPKYIFITHSHIDHIANLANSLLKEVDDNFIKNINSINYKKINIYCPIESEKYIREFINSTFNCNSCSNVSEIVNKSYNLIGFGQTKFKIE